MSIKDKSVLYGRAITHLNSYVDAEYRAKEQYSKAKKLFKEHKRSMKFTDGLPGMNYDLVGILASEDCSMLYDLGLLSHEPDMTNLGTATKLLNELKALYRNLFSYNG